LPTALVLKVLAHFRHNLPMRQFVRRFTPDYASTAVVSLEPFCQLALGLTRTKEQQRVRRTNTRNDRIVVEVAKLAKTSFTPVMKCQLEKLCRKSLFWGK
jgi:hypothetical protein